MALAAPVAANRTDQADQPVDEVTMNPHQRETAAVTGSNQRFTLDKTASGKETRCSV
jgi:hypothetical protein